MAGKRGSLEQRFWAKVIKTDGCWKWKATTHKGYGMIRPGGCAEKIAASRASWIIHKGDPGDLHVLHTCDNPECTNPEHLFLGTHLDNMADKEAKGRSRPEGWIDAVKHAAKLRRKLGEADRKKIQELRKAGATLRGLARMFGCDRSAIRSALLE